MYSSEVDESKAPAPPLKWDGWSSIILATGLRLLAAFRFDEGMFKLRVLARLLREPKALFGWWVALRVELLPCDLRFTLLGVMFPVACLLSSPLA